MKLGAVLWTSVKVSCWFAFRGCLLLMRNATWLLTGIQHQLWTNQKPGNYSGTAHVRTIINRFKMDLMIQPASLNNFIAVHHSFEDPDYVLKPHVTLYTLTETDAIFVESGLGIDASSSQHSSFFRIAQFQLAKRIIILPLHVFNKLAERIGDPKGRLIFLTNTSRCGSTLLTQVFEETGRSVAISEPDAMYAISSIKERLAKNDVTQLMRNTVRMLCKPTGNANVDTFVIKLSQQSTCLTPDIVELFPVSKHLFMYRGGIKVAQSVVKLMRSLPYLELVMYISRHACGMNLARRLTISLGLPTEDFKDIGQLICPLYCGAILWASSIHKYLSYKRALLPIVAVRYEDMVSDKHFAMRQIFAYCDLEYQSEATERAFSRDSQENSPISRTSLKQFNKNEFIDEQTTENLDNICAIFKVPRLYEFYIAEDTITYKGAPTVNQFNGVPSVQYQSETEEYEVAKCLTILPSSNDPIISQYSRMNGANISKPELTTISSINETKRLSFNNDRIDESTRIEVPLLEDQIRVHISCKQTILRHEKRKSLEQEAPDCGHSRNGSFTSLSSSGYGTDLSTDQVSIA